MGLHLLHADTIPFLLYISNRNSYNLTLTTNYFHENNSKRGGQGGKRSTSYEGNNTTENNTKKPELIEERETFYN